MATKTAKKKTPPAPAPTKVLPPAANHKSRVLQIAASDLKLAAEYQRELVPARVKALANELDLDSLGIVTVSQRRNGDYIVIDGQHRVAALEFHGLGEWKMKCNVLQGLSLEEEAKMFRRLNNTRRPTIFDDYRAGLVEGDPECLAVQKIVTAAGLRLEKYKADGILACTSAVLKVYRMQGVKSGAETLRDTLELIKATWGTQATALEGVVVQAVALVLAAYGDVIDKAVLTKKLAKLPGGPAGLIGRARSLGEIRQGSIPRLAASIIVTVYNKKRHGEPLSEL